MAPITNIQKVALANFSCMAYFWACIEYNLGIFEWFMLPAIVIWFITLLICVAEGSNNLDCKLTQWVRK